MMEVEATWRHSDANHLGRKRVKNQVCSFWLAGKCNRNPCRFMHRESVPPQNGYPHPASSHGRNKLPTRKMTWRNPNSYSARNDIGSANGGSRSSEIRCQSTQPIVSTNVGKVSCVVGQEIAKTSTRNLNGLQKVLTAERDESSETKNEEKIQPKQCRNWITGNCVLGNECKDIHSWFCGLGFTVLTKLGGHDKAITGIALPSGYDKLFSAGKDRCIRIWDCNSGQCVSAISVEGDVGCMISEGPMVFIGMTNTVKVGNSHTRAEFSLSGFVGQVHSLAADKDVLFAGIEDGTILVWKWCPEENIPKLAAVLKGHNGAVCSLNLGANRLYSGSRDCTIRAWDLKTLHCVQTLGGHTGDVTSLLCWDRFLFSSSIDNTLKIWAATEGGTIEVISEFKEECGFLALNGIHDAEYKPILLCSCNDNTARLYDLPSFNERGRIFTKGEPGVVEIGTGGLFFIGDGMGELTVCKLD